MARRAPQLEMSLPARRRWGGRRVGAGRKRGPTSGVAHAARAELRRLPAHITLRVRAGVPSLRTVAIVHAIERSFARGCVRRDFRLVHYSLQGNHAHFIVEAEDRGALGRGMMAIGTRLALAVNRVAKRTGRVLADRYHVRPLRTPREVRNALRYVLLNARKHAAGAAQTAVRTLRTLIDPASSARWFDGWRIGCPIANVAATGPRSVARARTWLLAVGWKRHGLLDPSDVPG